MRIAPFLVALSLACSSPPAPTAEASPRSTGGATTAAPARRVVLSLVGTNDLHGHIARLPVFGGYLANLRAARAADGGGVILVDGGDMFQGTLESNLVEGASVVAAYNALGYTAATIGNHEFDFGPVGERATPGPGDDPRGALKARAREARFPLLAANLIDRSTAKKVDWPNVAPSTTVEVAGIKVGIIGVTTEATPHTTSALNFVGLAMAPLADSIRAEASALRRAGAKVVIVAAHAGGTCGKLDAPLDASACKADEEIVQVARALPPGLVDAIVAGHTHAAMAHEIAGVAIIESFSKGVAFGRVDLTIERGVVVERRIHPPRQLCQKPARKERGEETVCVAGDYEGRPVVADAAIAALVASHQAEAAVRGDAQLGVTVERKIERSYGSESALGNLLADLMRAARPTADAALTNGGGIRADLAGGPLTYRDLYEVMPFDNRFAMVEMTAGDVAKLLTNNLGRDNGIMSVSGVRLVAVCQDGGLRGTLTRLDGTPIEPGRKLTVVTSDFLASGGDGAFGRLRLPAGAIKVEDGGATIRDELVELLRKRGGSLGPDPYLDRARPRLRYPGKRPVACGARAAD